MISNVGLKVSSNRPLSADGSGSVHSAGDRDKASAMRFELLDLYSMQNSNPRTFRTYACWAGVRMTCWSSSFILQWSVRTTNGWPRSYFRHLRTASVMAWSSLRYAETTCIFRSIFFMKNERGWPSCIHEWGRNGRVTCVD